MLPYSSLYTRVKARDHSLLRVLGGVLALLSIVLALLGTIFHQSVADLVIDLLVGVFALRVLILWLGDKAQSRQNSAIQSTQNGAIQSIQKSVIQEPYASSVRYPTRSSSYAVRYARQPVSYAAQYEQQPVSYAAPHAETQSFYQERTQMIEPSLPVPSPVLSVDDPTPPRLPRSIRPQRPSMPEAPFPTRFIEPVESVPPVPPLPPVPPIGPIQPISAPPVPPVESIRPVQLPDLEQQKEMQQPVSEWLTPADASVPVLLAAPKPLPDESARWQYDDEGDLSPRSREEISDNGTA